jgi:hypothetical protein
MKASELQEKYPIGSRWVDEWGQIILISQHDRRQNAIEFVRIPDEVVDEQPYTSGSSYGLYLEGCTPYVEPDSLPEFKFFGWIHPKTRTVRTDYDHLDSDSWGSMTWFEYGVEAGELFIRWCE